ncbi:MAG: WhiB family transcriptional regulator [Dehalococcoidia bacterium]|nr:WhiB family transcriptional regulator [Dehalococcoidia bacterium]
MRPDWHHQAACRDHDPDLWFPRAGQNERVELAQSICRACPVLDQCRDWVDRHDPPYGVWAGLTQGDRDTKRGHRGSYRSDPWIKAALTHRCGTTAGYARHRRNDEEACQACKTANTEYNAERTRRRRSRKSDA